MKHWRIQTTLALGALCLLVSLFSFPSKAKASNLIVRQEGIPCFVNPNPSLVINPRGSGGSITFDYGIPYNGVAGLYSNHQGLDLGLGRAFDVVAVYNGTVITHFSDAGSGGILAWRLDDPFSNYVVKYFHQDVYSNIWSTINVGDHLSQGQAVGVANGSGSYSDGPHLHLQVEIDGVVVDPKPSLLCGQGISVPAVATGTTTLPLPGEGSEAFRYSKVEVDELETVNATPGYLDGLFSITPTQLSSIAVTTPTPGASQPGTNKIVIVTDPKTGEPLGSWKLDWSKLPFRINTERLVEIWSQHKAAILIGLGLLLALYSSSKTRKVEGNDSLN